MHSGKIDRPQEVYIKPLALLRGWTGKAASWVMGVRVRQVWAKKEKESGPVGLFTQIPLLPLPPWKTFRSHCWWSGTSPGGDMRI